MDFTYFQTELFFNAISLQFDVSLFCGESVGCSRTQMDFKYYHNLSIVANVRRLFCECVQCLFD